MPRVKRDLSGYIDRTLSEGLGPRAGLRAARADGLTVQDSRWYREYNRTHQKYAMDGGALVAPLNRVEPVRGVWRHTRRRGYGYRVKGLLVDRVTGAQKTAIVVVTSRRPISRGKAIRMAMAHFQDPLKRYPSVLKDAWVIGAYRMDPA